MGHLGRWETHTRGETRTQEASPWLGRLEGNNEETGMGRMGRCGQVLGSVPPRPLVVTQGRSKCISLHCGERPTPKHRRDLTWEGGPGG